MPRSRVTLPQVRIWLVGRGKPRRWKHRGIAMLWYNGGQGRVRDSSPVGLENLRMPLLFPSPVTRRGE